MPSGVMGDHTALHYIESGGYGMLVYWDRRADRVWGLRCGYCDPLLDETVLADRNRADLRMFAPNSR